jgi:poly(hydroxyalkanoate) depolymerase family esterase
MKLNDNFVGDLLQAVRTSQGKTPVDATAIIQDALRTAGLLPAAFAPASAPKETGAARFVDLNAAPDWTKRFTALQPGQAGGHAPQSDATAPGQFLRGEFGNDAGSRGYRLYVPAQAATGPRPLVVMLHGCQQNPEDFAAGTAMNALAEQHGCLVLYPEQSRRANGSNCWNWFEAQHQRADAGEPSILAGMTRDVMREYDVDAGRVYVTGLSAGGAMAAILGAAHPDLFAAVGVHSGLAAGSAHDLMSGLNAMKGAHGKRAHHAASGRRVPAIVFHGDTDGVVHASNADAVVRQFSAGGKALREVVERGQSDAGRSHTKTVGLDEDGRAVVESWTLHGAGHAWSGGSAAGSYTDPAGPDASAEMLRFFLQHRLA